MMDPTMKIMIIDDEVDLCMLMRSYLVRRQYQVRYATSLMDGIRLLDDFGPDILFLDNNLPDGVGWDKTAELLELYPALRIYLMSAYQPSLPAGVPPDAYTILQKPISFRDLHFLCNNREEQEK